MRVGVVRTAGILLAVSIVAGIVALGVALSRGIDLGPDEDGFGWMGGTREWRDLPRPSDERAREIRGIVLARLLDELPERVARIPGLSPTGVQRYIDDFPENFGLGFPINGPPDSETGLPQFRLEIRTPLMSRRILRGTTVHFTHELPIGDPIRELNEFVLDRAEELAVEEWDR